MAVLGCAEALRVCEEVLLCGEDQCDERGIVFSTHW